jgi:pimeloyl-ACP methyl ester carboxylesterase
MGTGMLRSTGLWKRYLDHAYPGVKPAGYTAHVDALQAELTRPGRMAVVGKMGMSPPADAGAKLGGIQCPALVIMGTLDPDWADPKAEGEGVVAGMPAGLGRLEMIDGAGHYAHVQFPAEVATAIIAFLKETARG